MGIGPDRIRPKSDLLSFLLMLVKPISLRHIKESYTYNSGVFTVPGYQQNPNVVQLGFFEELIIIILKHNAVTSSPDNVRVSPITWWKKKKFTFEMMGPPMADYCPKHLPKFELNNTWRFFISISAVTWFHYLQKLIFDDVGGRVYILRGERFEEYPPKRDAIDVRI